MIGWFRPAAPTGLRRGDLLPGMLGYSKRRSWESFKTIEYVAGQIAAAVTHEAFR